MLVEEPKKSLARPERFELPTYCSGGNRSIQLSYGRAPVIIQSQFQDFPSSARLSYG